MKVTVVIPAYNEERYIEQTLKSLHCQSIRAEEIIVVDNNSTDRTAEIAQKNGARVIRELKKGSQHALHAGISESKSDIICCTDADTLAPVNWIETIVNGFQNEPHIHAITGPCHYFEAPKFIEHGSKILSQLDRLGYKGELIGANFAIKKDHYLQIGGVDKDLPAGWDIELGQRIRKRGKLKYIRNLAVKTSGRRFHSKPIGVVLRYFLNYLGVSLKKKNLVVEMKDVRK